MQNQNSPSRNLDADTNLPDVLELAIRKHMLQHNDMLPARIVSWNPSINRAQVEILYMVTMTDSSVHQMGAPAEVPTFVIGTGKTALVWPLKPGDLGWIKATDRDITLFLQSYKADAGASPRIHCFEDGIFIPDAMKDFVVVDADGVSLQTLDGTSSVVVKDGSIKLSVGSTVLTITDDQITSNKVINAPQFTDGSVSLIGHVHKENDVKGNTGVAKNP